MDVVWKGEAHPELDDRVRSEVSDLMANGLGHIDDLITHLIEVGSMEDGPLIEVHGHGGKAYASYVENPDWVTHHQQ